MRAAARIPLTIPVALSGTRGIEPMPSAAQTHKARRKNLALANTARGQRSASAPPSAVRAADAGAVDDANLSEAATARAAEPAAAASGAAGAADAMAAAESSSGGLDSSCAPSAQLVPARLLTSSPSRSSPPHHLTASPPTASPQATARTLSALSDAELLGGPGGKNGEMSSVHFM